MRAGEGVNPAQLADGRTQPGEDGEWLEMLTLTWSTISWKADRSKCFSVTLHIPPLLLCFLSLFFFFPVWNSLCCLTMREKGGPEKETQDDGNISTLLCFADIKPDGRS